MMDHSLVKLPVLAELACCFREEFDLSRSGLVACQHILKSTHSLMRSLFSLGLTPERTYVLGKCYSTDPVARTEMENDGVTVSVPPYEPFRPYSLGFGETVSAFVEKAIADLSNDASVESVVVLDDGGSVLRQVAQHSAVERLKYVGIEQTTAGYRALSSISLPFTVVNVARSDLKIVREAAIVGRDVWSAILHCLNSLQIHPCRTLIIGNGAIGSQIGRTARESMSVDYCDIDPQKGSVAPEKLREIIGKYDLIIGATGTRSLDLTELSQPDHPIVFVSSSSSDVEFAAHRFREMAAASNDWRAHVRSGNLILLASGFPINFFNVGYIPEDDAFELTRCILLAGAYQAYKESVTPGLVDLSKELQAKIAYLFHRRVGNRPADNHKSLPQFLTERPWLQKEGVVPGP